MRWIWPWVGALLLVACRDGAPPEPSGEAQRAVRGTPAAGRLLVLRLGDGVEVLRQRSLARAPMARREGPRQWRGRWEVQATRGRVLARGRFRLPYRRHALFDDVGGPAEAADVPLARPVVWLRVPVPAGARRVVLYDDRVRRRLGEVTL